jgi:hypothetical protein
MDAVDALVADPVEKAYRALGEAQRFLAGLDCAALVHEARTVAQDAAAFLTELNRRS